MCTGVKKSCIDSNYTSVEDIFSFYPRDAMCLLSAMVHWVTSLFGSVFRWDQTSDSVELNPKSEVPFLIQTERIAESNQRFAESKVWTQRFAEQKLIWTIQSQTNSLYMR